MTGAQVDRNEKMGKIGRNFSPVIVVVLGQSWFIVNSGRLAILAILLRIAYLAGIQIAETFSSKLLMKANGRLIHPVATSYREHVDGRLFDWRTGGMQVAPRLRRRTRP